MEKTYSTLYSQKATGKSIQWSIKVKEDKEYSTIITIYGQKDGKLIVNNRNVSLGKNIGKKNETTPFEQACSEALSKWKNKKEKSGYMEIILDDPQPQQLSNSNNTNKKLTNDQKQTIYPMLAQTYDNRKKHLKYPCYVQRKYDGIRCIAFMDGDKVKLMSRSGKEFPHLDHIKEDILKMNIGNTYLDGELFTNQLEFKKISGIIRKVKLKTDTDKENLLKIEYHTYDCFNLDNLDKPFSERTTEIQNLISNNNVSYIKQVETFKSDTEDDIMKYYSQFLAEDFEGIMIRNEYGKYKLKHRSNDLLKLKPFNDNEYKIVDYNAGTGREEGCVIWECDNANGGTFKCRPKGTLEERAEIYKKADEYIGKMLTVRYQEILDGSPRFGIGIDIRDYE
jgi:ATP-dependent DNA ligase